MTDQQWDTLVSIANGKQQKKHTAGFIIDSPWLPNWYGINILDYFSNDELWLKANLKAVKTFPDVIFLPGFWSEYGMCTEPSAFGAKCIFWRDEFPFAEKVIHSEEDIKALKMPNPETDGLLPFMLNRMVKSESAIKYEGHRIRFSVSRGPMNIASFLMGTTEFLTIMMMNPEAAHRLMRIITDFLKKWHRLQRDTFPSIEGILMLDDLVGFVGETEFKEFGMPYFKELFDVDAKVKMFHNDADCTETIHLYPEMGVNLYNPGVQMTLAEMIAASQQKMTILGNLPPRDVLAAGSPEEISEETKKMIDAVGNPFRIMPSCGGGMPPGVSTENIRAFLKVL